MATPSYLQKSFSLRKFYRIRTLKIRAIGSIWIPRFTTCVALVNRVKAQQDVEWIMSNSLISPIMIIMISGT